MKDAKAKGRSSKGWQTKTGKTDFTKPEKRWKIPKGKEMLAANPEYAARLREHGRQHALRLHADPVFAAAHAERNRAMMLRRHADPVFAAALKENMKKRNSDPSYREKVNAARNHYIERIRSLKAEGHSPKEARRIFQEEKERNRKR